MKLYLDEDISHHIAKALRDLKYDVISVHDLKANGYSDDRQLDIAISEKRILVSYNIKDYLSLVKDCISKGKNHYGIILISNKTILRSDIKGLISTLKFFIDGHKSINPINQVFYLSKY